MRGAKRLWAWVLACFMVAAAGGLSACTVDFGDKGSPSRDALVQDGGDAGDAGAVGDGALDDGAVPDAADLCGNGLIDPGEDCDGTEFGGRTCVSETGLPDGTLACTADCRLDTSACHDCGNGVLEGPEECEGDDVGGATCESRKGMASGTVVCDSDCRIDDSGCYECGDGLVTGPEECDDGALVDGDGCSGACMLEPGYGCSGQPSVCGCTVYVNGAGPAPGNQEDGTSWAHAFASLEDGFTAARDLVYEFDCHNSVMVWVGRGTYRLSDQLRTRSRMEVYGGFVGSETQLEQRSSDASLTVISPGITYDGALLEVSADRNVILDGLTFASGRSADPVSAGALDVLRASHLVVRNCRFVDNGAVSGGAVVVDDSTLRVEASLFEGNGAENSGGAIDAINGALLRVYGSTFASNQAHRGAGIAIYGGSFLAIRSSRFQDGTADDGAGIYVSELAQAPVLVDLTFQGNQVTGPGSAVYVVSHDLQEWTMVRMAFVGNSWNWDSSHGFGAVVAVSYVDKVTFQDVLLAGNHPTGAYSAALLSVSNGSMDVINATVAGNQAKDFADYNVTVSNSILWDNQWENIAFPATCRYSDVGDMGVCREGSSEAVISEDPLFVDEAGGDFHLRSASPCIDSGDGDVADASDIESNGRYDDPSVPNQGVGNPNYVDMGAYEYHP